MPPAHLRPGAILEDEEVPESEPASTPLPSWAYEVAATPSAAPSPATELTISDSDMSTPLGKVMSNDYALGVVTAAVQWLVVLMGSIALLCTFLPTHFVNEATNRTGPLPFGQRFSLFMAAVVTLGVAYWMHARWTDTVRWTHLPRGGSIAVSDDGVVISHRSVIDEPLVLGWDAIRLITFDTGKKHDQRGAWRRFPIRANANLQEFLFAPSSSIRPGVVMLSGRPVAPNMAIILESAVLLRNPSTELTDVAFPTDLGSHMPARPPGAESKVQGLLIHVENLAFVRKSLLPSGRVRSLRATDLRDFDIA